MTLRSKVFLAAGVIVSLAVLSLVSEFRTIWTSSSWNDGGNWNKKAPTTASHIPFQPPPNVAHFCVPWSVDTDEWWTHAPLWDLAEQNDSFTCFQFKPNNTQWQQLYNNQFRNDCSKPYTRHMWSSGFGTDLENVVLGLQKATMELHQPLTTALLHPRPWWHYSANKHDGSNATCPARDMTCYFLNTTNCTQHAPTIDKNPIRLTRKYVKNYDATLAFVLRPQQWLRKRIYQTMQLINLTSPCTVLHVRRADVVLHQAQSRKYFPIADYVQLLPSQKQQKSIFLLTDDANAIQEALEFFPTLPWVYFHRPRHAGASGGWESQVPSHDPASEVRYLLATLQLVPRCDTLIHSRSNFANLLARAMGPHAKKRQVDANMTLQLSANHSTSAHELMERLEQERNKTRTSRRNPS